MALSQKAAVTYIRNQIAEVTVGGVALSAVYAESETDGNAIPAALEITTTPAAIVFLGNDLRYLLSDGQQRHTYEVEVWLFCPSGGLDGWAVSVLDFVDAIREKCVAHVTLGSGASKANYMLYRRQEGPFQDEYGGIPYHVRHIILEVSEQGSATPAAGD